MIDINKIYHETEYTKERDILQYRTRFTSLPGNHWLQGRFEIVEGPRQKKKKKFDAVGRRSKKEAK